jgi:hypothetical protein
LGARGPDMTKEAEFIRKLKTLVKVPVITFAAKVLEVDEATASITAEPLDGRPKLFDVRLKSIIDEEDIGLMVIPAVDSGVLISLIGNDQNEAYVVKCNQVEKILLRMDDLKLDIADGEWIWNDGENGGLIKIEQLLSDVNGIKQDINSLKQVFSTWVPVAQDGGAALKSAISSYAGQTLTDSQKEDWENDKIKH